MDAERLTLSGGPASTLSTAMWRRMNRRAVGGGAPFDPIYDYPMEGSLAAVGCGVRSVGNGRRVEASLGRFPLGDGPGYDRRVNPVVSTVNSTARACRFNGQFPSDRSPQPRQRGVRARVRSVFGGLNRLTNYTDAVRSGLNIRPYDWESSVGINHELTTGFE